jgi:hypothetical protein
VTQSRPGRTRSASAGNPGAARNRRPEPSRTTARLVSVRCNLEMIRAGAVLSEGGARGQEAPAGANVTSFVLTVPPRRPGAVCQSQYKLVWATTCAGDGAPYSLRSSVV